MNDSPKSLLPSNLLLRVLSALALIPVVLGAVWVGEWAFFLLVALICGLGMAEWLSLTAPKSQRRVRFVLGLALFLILLASALKGGAQAVFLLALAVLLAGFSLARSGDKLRGTGLVWAVAGLPYLALSGLAMLTLRHVPEQGLGLTLYLLLVVWGTDTGAYITGRLIGGPKLLPSISPKKTWAGLIGGMAFAALMGYGVAHWFEDPRGVAAACVAVLLAVVAQAGDFLESWVKRLAGAKDSGTLIPGHGGVLDRVDGLIAAALVLAALVKIFGE